MSKNNWKFNNHTMNDNANTFLKYIALFSLIGGVGLITSSLNIFFTQAAPTQPASAILAVDRPYDFSDSDIVAKAAYVFDINEGKALFKKNAEAQLPLASIAKIPVALLAKKYLSPEEMLTITPYALTPEGDWGLTIGDSWKVSDLIDYTLMTSSNDGAAALAEKIEEVSGEEVVTLLNNQASAMGLQQTYFLNETGLDSNIAFSGVYGSAQDVGTLFAQAYITAPDTLIATAISERTYYSGEGLEYKAKNTNKAIGELPGLVFGKTGFTDLAGGNLAVVTESEPGHPFVIVVFGSTIEDRFNDVVKLTRATLRTPAK
ncbi:hypothetical protein CL644_02500 [bacterium]|nr:hypothetical protein [bacterium]